MKSPGGYILVDCDGLDFLNDDGKTFPGLYSRVNHALATLKPMYASNCRWGGRGMSAIPVMANHIDESHIVVTSSTLQVWISTSNVVNIVNMAPAE